MDARFSVDRLLVEKPSLLADLFDAIASARTDGGQLPSDQRELYVTALLRQTSVAAGRAAAAGRVPSPLAFGLLTSLVEPIPGDMDNGLPPAPEELLAAFREEATVRVPITDFSAAILRSTGSLRWERGYLQDPSLMQTYTALAQNREVNALEATFVVADLEAHCDLLTAEGPDPALLDGLDQLRIVTEQIGEACTAERVPQLP